VNGAFLVIGFFPLVDCDAGFRRTVECFRHGVA
jgi:hypothetical protein